MRTYPWIGDVASACQKGAAYYAVAIGCVDMPMPRDYSDQDVTSRKVRNMASNVAEWVRDDWDTYAYCDQRRSYPDTCQTSGATGCSQCVTDKDDCAKSCDPARLVICKAGTYSEFTSGNDKSVGVVRGGDYMHNRCFHRLFVRRKESGPSAYVGFRCAR
jgi:hypothetical protein